MEQEMPDYETICAAVVGEKWALEKVLDCYGCSSDWEEGHTTIRSRTIDRKFSHL